MENTKNNLTPDDIKRLKRLSSTEETEVDPGRTLGIVGLCFSIFLAPIGLLLSIIGYVKSKSAGFRNTVALIGICVSATWLVLLALLVPITIISYNGVTVRANSAQAQSNAVTVQTIAEVYNAETSHYPDEISDFTSADIPAENRLPSSITLLSTSNQLNSMDGETRVSYEYSGSLGAATGGRIEYWDFTSKKVNSSIIYLGDATSASTFSSPR